MSWITDGRNRLPRVNAKNIIDKQAQKRLDETVPAFQQQVRNALNVDAVDVVIYRKLEKIGRQCTCQQVDADRVQDSLSAPGNNLNAGFEMRDYGEDLFGTSQSEANIQTGDEPLAKTMEIADLQSSGGVANPLDTIESALAGGSVNCGICYQHGTVPALTPLGYTYNLLTTHEIAGVSGFYMDVSQFPAMLLCNDERNGWVDFYVTIPLFFTAVGLSVRNNKRVVEYYQAEDPVTGEQLSHQWFDARRGHEVKIRIRTNTAFTHATLLFDEGITPIKANISDEANVLSYSQELTVGNINVVLPSQVGIMTSGDVIVIPKRGLVLKVNDAPRKNTATRDTWEWACQTRTLQRSDPLRYIHYHNVIY